MTTTKEPIMQQPTRTFDLVLHAGETATDAARAFLVEARVAGTVRVVAIEPGSPGGGWPVVTYAGPTAELDKLSAYYDAPLVDAIRPVTTWRCH